jgi:hypothetical protein
MAFALAWCKTFPKKLIYQDGARAGARIPNERAFEIPYMFFESWIFLGFTYTS